MSFLHEEKCQNIGINGEMSNTQKEKTQKRELGEELVKTYIPYYMPATIKENKEGTDGYLHKGWPEEKKVQVKYDETIEKTQNLYKEEFEKTYPWQDWRKSPCDADVIFFISTKAIYKVDIQEIEKMKRYIGLKQISDTSKGYLIPLQKIRYLRIAYPDCQVLLHK